jgi:hypothetical protein
LQPHPEVARTSTALRSILAGLAGPCAVVLSLAMLRPLADGDFETVVAIWIAASSCLGALWVVAASPSWFSGSVAVGADGIVVHRPLHRRFHAWSRIHIVQLVPDTIVLESADGDTERLYPVDVGPLWRSLLEARERHRQSRRCQPLPAFEPMGEARRSWLRRARGVLRDPSYRDAGVDVERLLDLLGDVQQVRVQRVGAALALAIDAPSVRNRVSEIVADTVEPELADALAGAVAGRVKPWTWRRILRTTRRKRLTKRKLGRPSWVGRAAPWRNGRKDRAGSRRERSLPRGRD